LNSLSGNRGGEKGKRLLCGLEEERWIGEGKRSRLSEEREGEREGNLCEGDL